MMMKFSYRFIFYIIGCSLMFSCKVGAKYERPNLNTPTEFRGATATSATDSSFARVNWREFFNDPHLIGLIDSALSNYFVMRIALKNIEIEIRNLIFNKLNYFPSVYAIICSLK